MFKLLIILFVFVFLHACSSVNKNTVTATARGTLRFKCFPRDSIVEVNEKRLAPCHMFEKRGILLIPGVHRIVLKHKNYFPVYQSVEIKNGEITVMNIELRAVPL